MAVPTMPPEPMKTDNSFDDLNTPREAWQLLEIYLPSWVESIWEAAPGELKLTSHMRKDGYLPIYSLERSFFNYEPDNYDAIITNPPFSKKGEFLKRCTVLGKPWALLLPVTTPGVKSYQDYLRGCEIIYLPKRIDFTGGGAPWFAVAWFTKGFNLGEQLLFAKDKL